MSGFLKKVLKYIKSDINFKYIFLSGLIIRLFLMPFFASGDFTAVWTFVSVAIKHLDPWRAVIDQGIWTESSTYPPPFPYPVVMLYILLPFRAISYLWNHSNSPDAAGLFFLKIPLLLCDIIILFILIKLKKKYKNLIGIMWWLNPVSIYITYYHGHLDIIPVSLILISLYLIIRHKYFVGFLLLGIAGGAKSFPLLVLPIFLLDPYIKGLLNKAKYGIITILSYGLCIIPFYNSEAYKQTVLEFEEKNRIYLMSYNIIGDLNISLFFTAYIFLVLFVLYKFKDRLTLFIYGTGAILLLPVLFVPPQFTWFLWALPFCVLFWTTLKEYYYVYLVFVFSWFGYYLTFEWTELFTSWQYIDSTFKAIPRLAQWLAQTDKYEAWIKYSKIIYSILWSSCLFCMIAMSSKISIDPNEDITSDITLSKSYKKILLIASVLPMVFPIIISIVLMYYPAQNVEVAQGSETNSNVGEIVKDSNIEQNFISTQNNFSGAAIKILTYWNRENNKDVIIKISENKSKSVLAVEYINAHDLMDNEYYYVHFKPVKNSENTTYTISVQSPDSYSGNAISLGASIGDLYKGGDLVINGIKHEDLDINFKVLYNSPTISILDVYKNMIKFLGKNVLFFISYVIIIVGLYFNMVRRKKNLMNQQEN